MKALDKSQTNIPSTHKKNYILWMNEVSKRDKNIVGLANAAIGDLTQHMRSMNINVPDGFCITTEAYKDFCRKGVIQEFISDQFDHLKQEKYSIKSITDNIRNAILNTPFPDDLKYSICENYRALCKKKNKKNIELIVRCSGVSPDSYEVSSAQRHATIFNVKDEDDLLNTYKICLASLFTEEAVSYRIQLKNKPLPDDLSVGVQEMIHSDHGVSGTMLTTNLDAATKDTIVINASYGFGEIIVKGQVDPDEYHVFKPLLNDESNKPVIKKLLGEKDTKEISNSDHDHPVRLVDSDFIDQRCFALDTNEILQLAKWGQKIEKHFKQPVFVEWALDGLTGNIYIIQSRPLQNEHIDNSQKITHFEFKDKTHDPLCEGISIRNTITHGIVNIVKDFEGIFNIPENSVLVTPILTPHCLPALKKVKAVITEKGSRTSYSAMICRELHIPAIIGVNHALKYLNQGQLVTVDCSDTEKGFVYRGHIQFKKSIINTSDLPKIKPKGKTYITNPSEAKKWSSLPAKGIGLAEINSIIKEDIGIHPLNLIHYKEIEDSGLKRKIEKITKGYSNPEDLFVHKLAEGIAQIAAFTYPQEAVISFSNLTSKEYANLLSSHEDEPFEEQPEIGLRGASRHFSNRYSKGFQLECLAVKRARDILGFQNISTAIPFCRTIEEGKELIQLMDTYGLNKKCNGYNIHLIAEIPSNIILAKEFTSLCDSIIIRIDKLTEHLFCIDRDSEATKKIFNLNSSTVIRAIHDLTEAAHQQNKKVTILGPLENYRSALMEELISSGIDNFAFKPEDFICGVLRIKAAEEIHLQ